MMRYFDTFAILGVLLDEPPYRHLQGATGFTHEMNLLEAMVRLIRRGDPSPRTTVDRLGLGVVGSTADDLLNAAHIKVTRTGGGRPFSYVDALGYAVARRLKLRFLTGDPGFRGMSGVEFVA